MASVLHWALCSDEIYVVKSINNISLTEFPTMFPLRLLVYDQKLFFVVIEKTR